MAGLGSLALTVAAGVLTAAAGTAPCDAERLDGVAFLVGAWQVRETTDPGRAVGSSTVAPVAGGCALLESIEYPGGYREVRLLTLDGDRGVWEMAIVDSEHSDMVSLEGHRTDGRLEFVGTHQRAATLLVDRVSLLAREDGWVWRVESAAGYAEPWRLIQEVVYTPSDPAASPGPPR